MSINQALSAAVAGVNATQQALSVVAGNVANANTPGYVDESVNQVEVASCRTGRTSVDVTGINRNLNTLLQSQLWTETSGGFLRRTRARSSISNCSRFTARRDPRRRSTPIFNNFTSALQTLSTSPSSYSAQSAADQRRRKAWRKTSIR